MIHHTQCCPVCRRNTRRLTWAFSLFVILHALLIPLLPTLFAHALQASVGALVLGCVGLALYVSARYRR